MTDQTYLYQGKSKVVFPTEKPYELRVYFKDDATAFNGAKKGTIQGKGVVNCAVSTALYTWLETKGVHTHHIARESERDWRVHAVEIVPVEVVVRNVIAGSLSKRTGRPEGEKLRHTILELYYKSDELNDPMINDDHVEVFGWGTPAEIAEMRRVALRVNELLQPFFLSIGVTLVDYKLEFGRPKDPAVRAKTPLLLADEITPDGCRLWDATTGEKLDKDRFRRDLGRVEETYEEIGRRVLEGLKAHA